MIDTLDGRRANLSSLASDLVERLRLFRKSAGEADRIRLVYATTGPLTPEQRATLDDVRTLGHARLGPIFDVSAVSVATIYADQLDEAALAKRRRLTVPLSGHLAEAGSDLLVGSVSLLDLHAFLKAYRSQTGQLDQLFERNVRRFGGGRVKVNKGMQATLRETPERFGLFNNGITITVSDFSVVGRGTYELVELYVVNGCQTTRTIWEVLSGRLDAGGSGENAELVAWKARAANGCVVTKVAKVGREGEELLRSITRYTNSQNAVREKDFVSIDTGFKAWHRTMAKTFGVFLEIQRGGWDSQRALQRHNPDRPQFERMANALDLIKVYGAGWMSEAGLAFGKNPPFLPGGAVFTRMIEPRDHAPPFGDRDLYAAFLLKEAGREKGFGRGGERARRQTKFLFYFVAINLLRDALEKEHLPAHHPALVEAVIALLDPVSEAGDQLLQGAAELIDSYLTESEDNSVFNEPRYRDGFNFDLNAFLKWDQLGRRLDETPSLKQLLYFQKQLMGRGAPAPRKLIAQQISPMVR